MKKLTNILLLASSLFLAAPTTASTFTVSSTDIKQGEFMSKAHEFTGFGCEGGDKSPQLSWRGAPEGTEAFAIMAYDPDAPTGSGWWHWQVVNIDNDINSINTGAGNADSKEVALKGSQTISNDYGAVAFGGACPPKGHGVHRYQFTVHALSKKLELPANASGALTGYMVNANTLAKSTIEALYERK